MPTKARKAQDAARKAAKSNQYLYKGVPQVGDAALYGDNPGAHATQVYVPVTVVGPGDIVDDVDPSKWYTFYLFRPTGNADDAASELDRLRRAGWFKCEAPRFISPTAKFETRDGVLVLGLGIWYACPWERKQANRKAAREETGPSAVAAHHASLAATAKADGIQAFAERRVDERGQRTD